MFKFRSLEVVHWDFWERFTLPFDADVVTIVGPNGSGKTTLLDALRTLLAVDCSSGRNFKRYVRRNDKPFSWLRAVVSNERSDSGRLPFFPAMAENITLACRIQKNGGDWNRQYVVAEGDVSIEELSQEGARFLGVRDYQLRLANAGVTAAIRRVLALEQGATDKLCDYSPKQLLDLVFDSFGDGEVLENYRLAKNELAETKQELDSLETDLASLGVRLNDMRGRVNSLREWQNRKQELNYFEFEILPCAELAELREQICIGREKIVKLNSSLQRKQQEIGSITADRNALAAQLQRFSAEQADCQQKLSVLTPEFESLTRRAWELETVLKRKAELLALTEERAQGIDSLQLAEEKAQLLRRMATLEHDAATVKTELAKLQKALQERRTGKTTAPYFVEKFRQALEDSQIAHCLLTEIVEVLDPAWQAAVEGVLKPFAFVVLLENAADKQQAWSLGQKHRYRHFVVPDRLPAGKGRSDSLLEIVAFKQAPPSWLPRLLDRIERVVDVTQGNRLPAGQDWITSEGYHREQRGGRYIGVEQQEFQFGEIARQEQLKALETAIQELRDRQKHQSSELQQAEQRCQHIDSLLQGVDADKQLLAEANSFANAERQWPDVQEQVGQLAQSLADLQGRTAELTRIVGQFRADIAAKEKEAEVEQRYLDSSLTEITALQQQQLQRLKNYRQNGRKMPSAWREKQALEEIVARYGKAVNVRKEIELIGKSLDEGSWETDETVEAIHAKMEQDHSTREEVIKARRVHYAMHLEATNNAREQYINVLKGTVRLYSANIRKLGKLADVEISVTPPHLENDDISLTRAGLEVAFRFDQKSSDEASGGQQVMKSLILLIGLLMEKEEGGGFVFVDEPFAHLDILNIDRVSNFLLESGAQYVLTTPNTQNMNVFKPSDLTLVTQKRRHPDLWAPPIAFIRRGRDDGR